jgi:hypothetical protein
MFVAESVSILLYIRGALGSVLGLEILLVWDFSLTYKLSSGLYSNRHAQLLLNLVVPSSGYWSLLLFGKFHEHSPG